MSDSNPIQYSDLIANGTFEKIAERADMLLEHFKALESGIKSAVAPLGTKFKEPITDVKGLKDQSAAIEKTNAAYQAQINVLKEKAKIEKDLILFKNKLKKQNKEEADAMRAKAAEEKKANAQTREQIALAKANEKVQRSEAGSYNELSAKLYIVSQRWKKISADHRENSATGKLLAATKLDLTNKLKALDATTGVHVRNVGNYTGAIIKLQKGLGGLTGLLGTLGEMLGFDTEKMDLLINASHELIKTSKELHHVTELGEVGEKLHGEAIAETTTATEAETVATETNITATERATAATAELTTATEAQTVAQEELNVAEDANPIGLIIGAVVGLGAALYGLNEYLTSSSAETKKLARENRLLNEEYEESKRVTDNLVKVQESEVTLMKAQGVPLETIRKKEHEINAEKEKSLLNNIATIKSNIQLDISKYKDIQANDSIYESLLRVSEQTFRNLGLDDLADDAAAVLAANKKQRSQEVIEDYQKQADALAQAQADWNDLKAAELEQDKDITDQEIKNADDRIKKLKDQAQAEQDLLDVEADRLIKEMEMQNQLDDEMTSANEQAIRKLKAQRDEDAIARQQELDDELISQDQYNEDILSLDTRLADDIRKVYADAAADDQAAMDAEADAQIKAWQDEEAALQDLSDARAKAYDDELTQINDISKAFEKGLDDRLSLQKDALKSQTDLIESEMTTQTTLFSQGLDNTLDYTKRAREEAVEQDLKLERKAAKQKKGAQLAEAYISFVQSYLKAGKDAKTATVEAFAETMIVEGVSTAISGKYKDGVENLDGPGNETSDSIVARLSKGESVATAKATRETAGLVTAINEDGFEGAVDWAMRNIYAPNITSSFASDAVGGNANADLSLMLDLNNRLEKSIERGFSKIKITNWEKNAIGKLVETETDAGTKRVTTHHGRIC